jgi:transcriptional regulator with XRE-family HTH domain
LLFELRYIFKNRGKKLHAPDEIPGVGEIDQKTHEPVHPRSPQPKSPWEEYLRNFGKRVEAKRKGKPRIKVAKEAGISERTLKEIEDGKGRPGFSTLVRLAAVLGPFVLKGITLYHPRRSHK